MHCLGILLVAVMLLAGPAEGKETAKKKKAGKKPAPVKICLDLAPPATGLYRLLPADAEPGAPRNRTLPPPPCRCRTWSPSPLGAAAGPGSPAGGGAAPFRLDSDYDQVALAFPNSSAFTPWLGASALNQEAGEEISYRLGAGLGCDLDRSTRLTFGYHFATEQPDIGDPLGKPPTDADEETGHHFSLGLKKSF